MSNEWKIDSALRVKRFEATVMEKKVVSLETMIRDLEGMVAALVSAVLHPVTGAEAK